MGTASRIDLYAMCLNEARIIPHFLRHYRTLVDRFIISDNGSTDGSLAMLLSEPRVTIRPFETQGDSFVAHARELQNNVWKASRGVADWVVIVELDEHLHHPDLRGYLDHLKHAGVTAVRTIGYQMASDAFPAEARPLWQQVVAGLRDKTFDKLAIFDPDAVQETNYHAGRHDARPEGDVAYETLPQVKLLHFKNLGAEYVAHRNETLAVGLRDRDKSEKWGSHYLRTREAVERDVRDLVGWSRRVPGLAARGPLDLTIDEEMLAIDESGLFDAAYYMTMNPGVVGRSGVDPLLHFCLAGWREGKRPNAHFDPAWYVARYAAEIPPHVNPLLEYALQGERAGRSPTVWFDPSLYRQQRRVPWGSSPLLHLLRSEAAAAPGGVMPDDGPKP